MVINDFEVVLLVLTVFCCGGFFGILYELSNYRSHIKKAIQEIDDMKEDVESAILKMDERNNAIDVRIETLEMLVQSKR